ncbi:MULTISPECIES: type II restriction endonuclease [Leptospira]|uniref:Restriction endonuclease n=2 Tax=Leptospira kirschneri TaxID=29507 RepID=A0A1T1DG18_9LEPT|nr:MULTISPECIES: type II restriction endonuclease [Leptospira]EMJ87866.1 type-2 restriction enzyme EcoRV family protein [Leptospira kirschneri str. JB]EMK20203.1 type-2 restriction enzyme EcoRV family protein [Leptospira kirschneri serovar Bulgarica str. Nikolaevo]OOV39782.1 restriction endonuclease [Leptospira kirschneri serovar Pomona]UML81409.1 EcoRV family type II restriction endonuclease [Leptospira kirschneri]
MGHNFKNEKESFKRKLKKFSETLSKHISGDDNSWTIKGFIDIFKNLYTISGDTKIVSKILEIHLFPKILEFAKSEGYNVILAEHQNWYPDISFVHKKNPIIKFAIDLKTTFRDPSNRNFVNGFTLGSHGAYFKNRKSDKNIQFPYSEYLSHFCLGIIYSRNDVVKHDERTVFYVEELHSKQTKKKDFKIAKDLASVSSVITNIQFFVVEKWEIASDKQGSGNTANIGSINHIDDIINGQGMFSKLGEETFDEYWMNYGSLKMKKGDQSVPITNLADFLDFTKGDKSKIIPRKTKKKNESNSPSD